MPDANRLRASPEQIKAVARQTKRSANSIRRWVRQGCDLNSPASINQFLRGNQLRQHPNLVRRDGGPTEPIDWATPDLNLIELPPAGPRGAAAALQRLEEIEERAHARLMRAIEAGNPFQVKNAQEFYLRCSETLRRLDAAIETERRQAEEQVPMRQIEAIAAQISDWLR